MHTESSLQSRPVLLDFMQLGLWFLEHFSDGKDSLNSPGSPPLDIGAHLTSLPVLWQSQLFMQLCGKMLQGGDLSREKRNLKIFFSIQITSVIKYIRKPHEHFCWHSLGWARGKKEGCSMGGVTQTVLLLDVEPQPKPSPYVPEKQHLWAQFRYSLVIAGAPF